MSTYRIVCISAFRELPWWQRAVFWALGLLGVSPLVGLAVWVWRLDVRLQYLLWLVMLFIVVLYVYRIGKIAWEKTESERKRLSEPKFEIVFDPHDPLCFHENISDDNDGNHVVERTFYLGLRNLCGVTIPNVIVRIWSLQPWHRGIFRPTALLKMNEWMAVSERYDGFPLHAGTAEPASPPTEYVQVARKRSSGNASDHIELLLAERGYSQDQIPPGQYMLVIRAQGTDSPMIERQFELSVNGDGILHMKESRHNAK